MDDDELAEAKAYVRGRRLLNRERSVDLAEELSDGEALGIYESTSSVPERNQRRHAPERRSKRGGLAPMLSRPRSRLDSPGLVCRP